MPRFVKGHPGGPGRPRGSRNRTTLLIESLAPLGEARVLSALAEAAADGDMAAARVLFARVWPRSRAQERKCRSDSVEKQLEALGVGAGDPGEDTRGKGDAAPSR